MSISTSRRLPQERLDGCQVGEDPLALGCALSERVVGPLLDPREHHVDGRAEQDDRVEATVELPLVRPAPGRRRDDPRRARRGARRAGPRATPTPGGAVVSRRPSAPVLRIGVDDTMATAAERRQCRRLPRTGHARDEHLRHRRRTDAQCMTARRPWISRSAASSRSASTSIWRMRSRVRPNSRPISSSVRGSRPSSP